MEMLIEYAGMLISLLLRFAPYLSDWFAKLDRWYKVAVVAGLALLWAVGVQVGIEGAGELIGLLDTFVEALGLATLTHVVVGSKEA